MDIKFNEDSLSVTVDLETYLKMSQGTEFQKSINLLVMLKRIMEEADKLKLDNLDLTIEQREVLLQELNRAHEDFLRLNPPPGIDQEALQIFCN